VLNNLVEFFEGQLGDAHNLEEVTNIA
jgi:hypothetical protein